MKSTIIQATTCALALLVTACSTTKGVPDGDRLFTGIKVISYDDDSLNHALPIAEDHLESTMEEVEADIKELSRYGRYERIFLQGADPFILPSDKLLKIAELIHRYRWRESYIFKAARSPRMIIRAVTISQMRSPCMWPTRHSGSFHPHSSRRKPANKKSIVN